jgi:fructosamine-3-kinase
VSLEAAVGEAAGAAVTSARRVAGGDINDAWAMELADGRRVFVKTRDDAPAGEYEAEAAALAWLAQPGAVRVPGVVAVADDAPGAAGEHRAGRGDDAPGATDEHRAGPRFLALEWVEAGRLSAAGEEELGRGLAGLHRAGAPAFGAYRDVHELRVGPLSFDMTPADDWPRFYAERLLLPLLPRAGALSASGARAVERLCERLGELAGPAEPPARLHGDLWSGNVLAGADGRPWLVDPAAYGGHREVDLAMLRLFGAPSPRTLAAYEEALPLADGHQDRVRLWQLFPLLVHTVLFGGSYGASAEDAARRYVG